METQSHYFVDEAGDGTLYDKHGKCLIGTEGCSKFFMLGVVVLRDPKRLMLFASRGNSNSTKAFAEALKPIQSFAGTVSVGALASRERPELQAADYFLWTLQRFFENGDERYLPLMGAQYESVCYMHPVKSMTYYTKKEPLSKAALAKFTHEGLPKI